VWFWKRKKGKTQTKSSVVVNATDDASEGQQQGAMLFLLRYKWRKLKKELCVLWGRIRNWVFVAITTFYVDYGKNRNRMHNFYGRSKTDMECEKRKLKKELCVWWGRRRNLVFVAVTTFYVDSGKNRNRMHTFYGRSKTDMENETFYVDCIYISSKVNLEIFF